LIDGSEEELILHPATSDKSKYFIGLKMIFQKTRIKLIAGYCFIGLCNK
jgi:hypothetical protein